MTSRNPWPIALITFFAVFISLVVAYTVFATRQRMDLVQPNYYEDEIRFQEQLDRLNRTRSLAAGVAIAYDAEHETVTIALPAVHALTGASGRVQFYRPSDAGLDRDLPLALNAEGRQCVEAKALRAGLWKVRVRWKADEQEFFFDQPIVVSRRSF